VCEFAPLLPVTVRVEVPVGALRLGLIVSVEVPGDGTGFVPKLALVLCGKPLTLRLTELEPLTAPTVTVVDPLEPRLTVSELEEVERLKSGGLLEAPTVNELIAVAHI
jgi:hypothetical protein